jgi:serine protease Do
MKRSLSYLFVGLLALSITGCAGTTNQSTSDGLVAVDQQALEKTVLNVKPTIVRIKVVEPDYYDGREQRFVAFGSGTIISPDGYVMTNHHVAGKAVQLMVTMSNREEIPAILVGTDAATDIAVIKLQPQEPTEFPYTKFADSDLVKVGDAVMAMGSPGALSQSVTLGIVSNTEMVMPERSGGSFFKLDGENVGNLVRWFGHDAAIYPGNSGGPLINMDGKIVGVNEIGVGLGGAIPGNLARQMAEEIIEHGKVKRAYMGFSLQPLLKSSPIEKGALISSVQKESPAMKAQLEPGDILLSVEETELVGKFREDLPAINNLIAGLAIDKPVSLTVWRDGQELDISVTPEERQPTLIPNKVLRQWGMTAQDLTLWVRLDQAREEAEGVVVTSTSSGAPVARAKPEIKPKDIITGVNNEPVINLEDLIAKTKSLTEGKEEFVSTLVSFERDGEEFLTVVELGIEELPPPGREVRKAWLPVETQPLTKDTAEILGLEGTKGVRVTRLYEASDDFPLQVGDIITTFDGDPLDISRSEDNEIFRTLLRQYRIGTEVEAVVIRDGEEVTVAMELGTSPKRSREMERYRDLDFELVVREATFKDHQKPTLEDVDFAVVFDSVTAGGWASLAGLQVGDALLGIDGQSVSKIDDVQMLLDKARGEKTENVVFYVRRRAANLFLEAEPQW